MLYPIPLICYAKGHFAQKTWESDTKNSSGEGYVTGGTGKLYWKRPAVNTTT